MTDYELDDQGLILSRDRDYSIMSRLGLGIASYLVGTDCSSHG